MNEASCCHTTPPGEPLRVSRNLKISLALLLCLIAVSFLPPLSALNASLLGYLKLLAIPLIVGFLLGGAVDYFVPQGFIYRYLGATGNSSLFYALAGGFLMSSCSHGILAIAIQIYRKGAGIPAVHNLSSRFSLGEFSRNHSSHKLFRMEGRAVHSHSRVHSDCYGLYLQDA